MCSWLYSLTSKYHNTHTSVNTYPCSQMDGNVSQVIHIATKVLQHTFTEDFWSLRVEVRAHVGNRQKKLSLKRCEHVSKSHPLHHHGLGNRWPPFCRVWTQNFFPWLKLQNNSHWCALEWMNYGIPIPPCMVVMWQWCDRFCMEG